LKPAIDISLDVYVSGYLSNAKQDGFAHTHVYRFAVKASGQCRGLVSTSTANPVTTYNKPDIYRYYHKFKTIFEKRAFMFCCYCPKGIFNKA